MTIRILIYCIFNKTNKLPWFQTSFISEWKINRGDSENNEERFLFNPQFMINVQNEDEDDNLATVCCLYLIK